MRNIKSFWRNWIWNRYFLILIGIIIAVIVVMIPVILVFVIAIIAGLKVIGFLLT